MAYEQQMWTNQMPQHVVATQQQSLIVVKKLLAIAVSSITYLRGLFPEKAYGSKYVEEQKVMILREERTCPGASQVVQWLKGCFDALHKRYLRTVLLSIYCDPENPQNVTECYEFRIYYNEKGPLLDIGSKKQKGVTKMAYNDIKKASVLLVRKLYTLIQNLGPLPESVCLNMKLSYYDEVTPQDYQPPGFKEGDSNILVFGKESVKLTMGQVVTPFHTLKVDITTERERLEQVKDDQPICARERWALENDEEKHLSVESKFITSANVVIETGIENSDVSKEELTNSQLSQDWKDCALAPSANTKQVSQFQFPLSQDILPAAPKRRKFSVPKASH